VTKTGRQTDRGREGRPDEKRGEEDTGGKGTFGAHCSHEILEEFPALLMVVVTAVLMVRGVIGRTTEKGEQCERGRTTEKGRWWCSGIMV
jgi:hypothetical protein